MEAEEIRAGLARALDADGPGAIAGLARLTGGASLETWAFDLVDSQGGARPLILRRRDELRSVAVVSTSITLQTEARLLQAAGAAGVPVAEVVRVCAPGAGLGEGYVMGRVEGETLGRRIVREDRFAEVRPRLAGQCGEILARVHAMSPTDFGLEAFGAAEVLARYEAIYRQIGEPRTVLEAAFRFLERRAPPAPDRPVLLHGDFRNGNLMIDPDRGVVAVLDWELAHRGDPAEDLSWVCVNSWRFGAVARPVGGFGDYADLLDGYARAGGGEIALDRVLVWQMIGSLKWAVMCQMMSAGGPEVATLERMVIGRRVSECEADLVALMERLA